jgi:hypothetical protein
MSSADRWAKKSPELEMKAAKLQAAETRMALGRNTRSEAIFWSDSVGGEKL